MGPPPGPEHMAEILSDPQYAAQLNEALSNPDIINHLVNDNPMFRGMGDSARQALQNPEFRRLMTDPDMLRQMAQMQRQFPGMFGGRMGAAQDQAFPAPGVTDQTPDQPSGERTATPQQPPPNPFGLTGGLPMGGGTGAGSNPFLAMFGLPSGAARSNPSSPPPAGQTGTAPQQQQQQQQQDPSIQNNPLGQMAAQMASEPQFMQNFMRMLGGGGGGGGAGTPGQESGGAAPPNPFAAMLGGPGGFGGFPTGPPAPPDNRPPEERYAEQLRQLNDMGFYEFERNVEALRRTGGSVQGAVEYLLTH